MFTSGLEKIIVIPGQHDEHLSPIFLNAERLKHEAVSINNVIYIRGRDDWEKTCFTLDDFKVTLLG